MEKQIDASPFPAVLYLKLHITIQPSRTRNLMADLPSGSVFSPGELQDLTPIA